MLYLFSIIIGYEKKFLCHLGSSFGLSSLLLEWTTRLVFDADWKRSLWLFISLMLRVIFISTVNLFWFIQGKCSRKPLFIWENVVQNRCTDVCILTGTIAHNRMLKFYNNDCFVIIWMDFGTSPVLSDGLKTHRVKRIKIPKDRNSMSLHKHYILGYLIFHTRMILIFWLDLIIISFS